MKTGTKSALVTDIQRFCMHDGPGLRTVIFFKGCPLHCAWCHNPETKSHVPEIFYFAQKCIGCGACLAACSKGQHSLENGLHQYHRDACRNCGVCAAACPTGALQISGKEWSVEELLQEVRKDAVFYANGGGLTISGGEPTLQQEALLELLKGARETGIGTAMETCGVFSPELIPKLVSLVDCFLYDIKDTDEKRLKKYTGGSLQQIEDNLLALDALGAKSILRCILVPEVNMEEFHIRHLAELFKKLKHAEYVELLPYHPYGTSKGEQLGKTGESIFRKPEKQESVVFAKRLADSGVPVKLFGEIYRL